MFTLTQRWLEDYYGSASGEQRRDAKAWLLKYGKDVPGDKLDEWANWKHLIEYQINTPDIVPKAIEAIGGQFTTEIAAHWFINEMRVPMAKWYVRACEIADPDIILELGVGGDSAISTAAFLCYLSRKPQSRLISVDRNPLGMTLKRYSKFPNWAFLQRDSVEYLKSLAGARLGMIFIDTIHSYEHTLAELNHAKGLTDFLLMDDCNYEGNSFDGELGGVKRAIATFLQHNTDWSVHAELQSNTNIALLIKR